MLARCRAAMKSACAGWLGLACSFCPGEEEGVCESFEVCEVEEAAPVLQVCDQLAEQLAGDGFLGV